MRPRSRRSLPPCATALSVLFARAEAKKTLLTIITILESHEAELKKLIEAAGDDQQKKMATVIPKLQSILGSSLEAAGFPKPPMGAPRGSPGALRASLAGRARRPTRVAPALSPAGAMQAMMAFTTASTTLPGGEVLKKGMDILKAGMMGQFPSTETISAVKAELA